jgi:hypothetical protein
MRSAKALQVHVGPRALQVLQERGLNAAEVRAIPAAAGGPKGLVLLPLDQYLFGRWLPQRGPSSTPVHLLGASIGSWRMASACLTDPVAALRRLGHDYIHQQYESPPGKPPKAEVVSRSFGSKLVEHFGGQEAAVLSHPQYRLHVFTSRGRHVLRREGKLRTPLGYLGAFASNALSRRALGGWLERVVFSDARSPLTAALADFRTRVVALGPQNLQPAILASCSIPFWLKAVHDIPGAPRGAYWDGGITDYHLHLNHAALFSDGLVLYPHFQPQVIPGWLDKAWRHRHRPSAALDNVVLLCPQPQWIRRLPGGKLPDRSDFQRYALDFPGRVQAWTQALAASEELASEFEDWTQGRLNLPLQPL